MRNHLIGRAILPNLVAELRTYVWEREEAYTLEDPNYHIVRLNRRKPSGQTVRWCLENQRHRPVLGTSILAARRPLTLKAGPGETTFLSCLFPPDNFERMVKVDEWSDELTANCLSMRNPFLAAVLDRLAQEIAHPTANSNALLRALAASIRADVINLVPRNDQVRPHSGSLSNGQLKEIRENIDLEDWSRGPPTMQELATRCSISVRHMMRGFKAATGSTVHTYIRHVRMERAKTLLASEFSSLSIREICAHLGFTSSSHFSAEFRQLNHLSPSQYRARLSAKRN